MHSSKKSILFALVAAVAGLFALTGCNTMKGVGQDVERAGEKIQDNAK